MGIFYDLKRSLLQRFLELAPTAKASEVVFSPPSPTNGSMSKEVLITLSSGDVSRTFAVDRADLTKLFTGYKSRLHPVPIRNSPDRLHEIIPCLSDYFGIPLSPEDLIDIALPKPTGSIVVKASPQSLRYSGEFSINLDFVDIPHLPTPRHHWMLDGNTADSGSNGIPLTAGFKYTELNGTVWGERTLLAAEWFGNNIKLPMDTDFTLDVFLYPVVESKYTVLLSNNPAVINNTGTIMFYYGKPYLAYLTDPYATNLVAMVTNAENRLTIRRTGNVFDIYLNKLLVLTKTITTTLAPWTAFGDAENSGDFATPNKLRNLRYWNRSLKNSELDILFSE